MSTKPTNNLVRVLGVKKSLAYPVDQTGAFAFNAGDLVCFNGGVLKAATDALAAGFAGVAQNSNAIAIYAKDGVIVNEIAPQVDVVIGCIHALKTTVADSLAHGDAVYIGADAQTVVKADPGSGKAAGYVQLRPSQGTITGASGVFVDVLIVPQYPIAGIA